MNCTAMPFRSAPPMSHTAAAPEVVVPLWEHQRDAIAGLLEKARSHGGCVLDMGMGCGKTRTMLTVMAAKAAKRPGAKFLLVCPAVAVTVWEDEKNKYWPLQPRCGFASRAAGQSVNRFAQQLQPLLEQSVPLIAAVTYDSLRNDALRRLLRAQQWAVIVCDESHKLINSRPLKGKNPGSRIAHIMNGDRWNADLKIAMSGTTHPRSWLELHGQLRFAAPDCVPADWWEFLRQNAHIRQARWQTPGAVTIKAEPGRQERTIADPTRNFLDWLSSSDAPVHIAPPVDQLIDLPPVTHISVNCELDQQTARIYKQLENTGEATLPDGRTVSTRAGRTWTEQALRQLTAGGLDGWHAASPAKHRTLRDHLDALPPDEKVVVFCHWRQDHQQIRSYLKTAAETVTGDMTPQTRRRAVRRWADNASVRVLTFNPEIAESVDLTAARHAVFFSLPWKPQALSQSIARLHRAGQTRKTFAVSLLCTINNQPTIDHAQHRTLTRHIAHTAADNHKARQHQSKQPALTA